MLQSLLDFRPELYGLPPFNDLMCGVVPLQPVWHLKGEVIKGFGRGSRELGIPTANLHTIALQVLNPHKMGLKSSRHLRWTPMAQRPHLATPLCCTKCLGDHMALLLLLLFLHVPSALASMKSELY